jgi:hypothetical protein
MFLAFFRLIHAAPASLYSRLEKGQLAACAAAIVGEDFCTIPGVRASGTLLMEGTIVRTNHLFVNDVTEYF